MDSIIIREKGLFDKFIKMVSKQDRLSVEEKEGGYTINSKVTLGKQRSHIIGQADCCQIWTEEVEEGLRLEYSLSFFRLKVFYIILGLLMSTVFWFANQSYIGVLMPMVVLGINYVIQRYVSVRGLRRYLGDKLR